MRRHNKYRGRYTTFHLPDIEKCSYENSLNSYICREEKDSADEEEDIWSELENFFRMKISNTLDKDAKNLLTEILHWIEKRDIYTTALLFSLYWERIEVLLAEKACSESLADFIVNLRFSIE